MSSASTLGTNQFLTLSDGRSLAYQHNGNPESKTVILYFHGSMHVGDARHLSAELSKRGVHFIAPTLPGWGQSSPRPSSIPFHILLPQDMTALLQHLHPSTDGLELYVAGGSYGSCPAQIIYGAPFDRFPLGRKIKACLHLGGFAPLYKDPSALVSHLSWSNYILIGPPSRMPPLSWVIPKLFKSAMKGMVGTEEAAATYMRQQVFNKMGDQEKAKIEAAMGEKLEDIIQRMGHNVHESVKYSWKGLLESGVVTNEDWELRDEVFIGSKVDGTAGEPPKMLIVAFEEDEMMPRPFAEWCARNYRNAELRMFPGGHVGALGYMDEIWKILLDGN
ncbi:Alpha/Beta hydrolase protein [Flagelloscypha sp. PMI_526]|nr:Alpha/Beta hydrolase protein [Flagelloscypha sp. PMI_526]